MDINKVKRIYMIGIKGVGMTMLAQFLKAKGYEISGSDVADVYMTDEVLHSCEIPVKEGFDVANIDQAADLVIYSSAYNENNNVELAALKTTRKLQLSYAEALGHFFAQYYGIAVVGSHGKTTTSAWLGYVLMRAGLEPNVMVGAKVKQLGGASITGSSDYLVIEADEYQNKLRFFQPRAVLLNNIDYDHPDFFPTRESYTQVFADFAKKIPSKGFLVANQDDVLVREICSQAHARILGYAIDSDAMYMASEIEASAEKQLFRVSLQEEDGSRSDLGQFAITLTGKHNIYNALAVIAAAIELNVPLNDIRTYLEEFSGTSRRMETLGTYRGALIIDDYAHHPSEISATLAGARKRYPDRRILTVFHPHTFTRTKGLLHEFSKAFADTDELVVLDIYGSAREQQGGVHSKDLILLIEKERPDLHIVYIPTLAECVAYLRQKLGPGYLVMLMGAGDVFRVGERLVA